MPRFKKLIDSNVLQRTAHIDVFELSTEPKFLFVLFGGSGIVEEEYVQRNRTVIPIFDRVLDSVPAAAMTLLYVTSPFDVPLLHFAKKPELAEKWNYHVLSELLAPWDSLPFFLASFSGGAALAFHGVHEHGRCIGGTALGFDGLADTFRKPDHWRSPLRFYCGLNDRVCNRPANQSIIAELVRREQADVFQLHTGSHRLVDYATTDCLGREIDRAHDLVRVD